MQPASAAAALTVVALTLPVQAALGGVLVGSAATPLAVLALALYIAGRELTGAMSLGRACAAVGVVAATRIVFDPAARTPLEGLLTCVAVATPLLVGRWARGQHLLQQELTETAVRRARTRARDARHAAEAEHARIAADLQLAVTGALGTIVESAVALEREGRAVPEEAARERLAAIAATARAALADVRRVLGVLRRDGEAPSLAPPEPRPSAPRELTSAPRVSDERPPAAAAGRSHYRLVDQVPVAIVAIAGTVELAIAASPVVALTAVLVSVPLLWRRRWPLAAAIAVLAAIALQSTWSTWAGFRWETSWR